MHENSLLVIENHYLGAILEKNQFDTFYHEHPRTYSLKSFVSIAEKLKKHLSFISFPNRYGGNIRVFISNKQPSNKILNFITVARFSEKKKGLDLIQETSIRLIEKNIMFKWKIIGENSEILNANSTP